MASTPTTQTKDTGGLLSLPNEALLQIGQHLDELAAASFSLACTRLHKLRTAYPASEWSKKASKVRPGCTECYDGHPDIVPRACGGRERWEFLKLLAKDLKATHHLCIYCRAFHRLLPESSPQKTSCHWMALGPNYWSLGKLTFDDCYHALHDPDNPVSSLRTTKALGGQQYQVSLAWPIESRSSAVITLPTTKTAYHLPSLSFSSDWKPHPLSTSSPDSPYRHLHVKASLSSALVHLPSSNNTFSSFKHPNLLTYSIQHLYLPPKALDTQITDVTASRGWHIAYPHRPWLGFQTCRHQPSYAPETINNLLNQTCSPDGEPRDLLEETLNISYNKNLGLWSRPGWTNPRDHDPENKNKSSSSEEPIRTTVFRAQVCHCCQTRYRAVMHSWGGRPQEGDDKLSTQAGGIEVILHVWQNLGPCRQQDEHAEGNFANAWFAPVGKTREEVEIETDANTGEQWPGFWKKSPGARMRWWGSYELYNREWAYLDWIERRDDAIWGEFWWCESKIARDDTKNGWLGRGSALKAGWTRRGDLPGKREEGKETKGGDGWGWMKLWG